MSNIDLKRVKKEIKNMTLKNDFSQFARAPYSIRPVFPLSYSPTIYAPPPTTPNPKTPRYTQNRPLSTTLVRLPLATCLHKSLLPSPPTRFNPQTPGPSTCTTPRTLKPPRTTCTFSTPKRSSCFMHEQNDACLGLLVNQDES